jgi:hypothetical protein
MTKSKAKPAGKRTVRKPTVTRRVAVKRRATSLNPTASGLPKSNVSKVPTLARANTKQAKVLAMLQRSDGA